MNKKELPSQYQVEIKPLQLQDIDRFNQILKQHVRDRETGEILENEIAEIIGYMRGQKDDYGRIRRYFAAKTADGKVLGCMAYTSMDPDMVRHFSDLDPQQTVELVNAFVDSEIFRGGGVGRKLFDAICAAARAEGKTCLTVNSGPRYKASWGFYDNMCTANRGFIIGKFGPGGDANTWVKNL